jgi:hypothetical protein
MAESLAGVWKKLNYKSQDPVLVINAPGSFKSALAVLAGFGTGVHAGPGAGVSYGFILAFARNAAELEQVADLCLPCMADGAVLWFGFPKQSSKTIRSDINRDKLADQLALRQLQPNRNVAIDDDWSALRFRRALVSPGIGSSRRFAGIIATIKILVHTKLIWYAALDSSIYESNAGRDDMLAGRST